ncbi:MAG TPA: hypothetical protein VEX38_01830, partial [Fimbriimonadaceae bacterium]|nr:hypothetical protein [Fimbriimonadaceae bacterium]
TLLLSASQAGVNCLADLTADTPAKEEPTFGEVLEQQVSSPVVTAVVEVPEIEPVQDESVQAALDRLNRLAV